MSELRVCRFSGEDIEQYIPALAHLRLTVFRDFPYLYDGSPEYEAKYLQTYRNCPGAVVVIAFDGDEVVGASTAVPMAFEEDSFRKPFQDHGFDPNKVFYLAESVLLKPYRGQGIGVRFFAEREAHARELGGFSYYAFCAVTRPEDHPLRPAGYTSLDAFWRARGYEKYPDLQAVYRWKDVDQPGETLKKMEFWLKSVDSSGGCYA